MSRVLVIDDDASVRETVVRMLRSAGHRVESADDGAQGVELARHGAFDVVLSDLQMPGMTGLEVLGQLREHRVDSVFIIMTAFGTIESAIQAMRLGAVDFVQKPFYRDEILMRVKAAADRRQLARQVTLLQRRIRTPDGIAALIGDSEPMQRVRDLLRRTAVSPGTVLITGETGTGKELAARAIHALSDRAGAPFVPLNCAALTETLLENELFGHARGAFTGAVGARPGLLEHASGGTLFLDEIGTMSGNLQAKLLRTLESGEVRRIGENETRRVDVRFVAATNVDLRAAVDRGEFRGDLFYRLNVLRVHMPPLKDRPGDVRLLAEHFLAIYGRPMGITDCTSAAWTALLAYRYPGNVRELEHLLQRAVAVALSGQIDVPDLPEELVGPEPPPELPDGTVTAARDRADRDMILAALSRSNGEITAAARELDISRTTMWRLMKKHGISSSD
jgi:two-component system response regulator HydG